MKAFEKTAHHPASPEWIDRELPLVVEAPEHAGEEPRARILTTAPGAHPELAVLLTMEGANLRVNGAVPLAVTVLADRDGIRTTDGRILLFAAYAGTPRTGVADAASALVCSNCTLPIDEGESWIACSACAVVYHAEPPKQPNGSRSGESCRSYDTRCKGCKRLWTSMSWTPAELGYDD